MNTSASRRPSRRAPWIEAPKADPAAEATGYQHEDEHSLPARPRLGPLRNWERRMLRVKLISLAALSLGCLLVVLWATKP